jgi:aldose 1-epimerase
MMKSVFLAGFACFVFAHAPASAAPATIRSAPFGKAGGQPVEIYTLDNGRGVSARITNFGGTVVNLWVPDRQGRPGDVVWGFDRVRDYETKSPYFGCLIGRYGNRIARGKFTLDGQAYRLATNDGPNALHGGLRGFDKVVWEVKSAALNRRGEPALALRYLSRHGEEGYPGNLDVTAVYTLTRDNGLRVDFSATTDRATVVNLTHHSYFNLAGSGDILGHEVMIRSDRFTPVDKTLIPTGELRGVKGTPFDFNRPTAIGARIGGADEQLKFGKGYDHNWVIRRCPFAKLCLQAKVTEPTTGRSMEVWSTEPALQFYSGNFLDGTIRGKGGQRYGHRSAFCMEPQHYPDSPNQPAFPSTTLRPGETYKNTIVYRFGAK